MKYILALIVTISLFSIQTASAQDKTVHHRVVMQLSSPDTAAWKGQVNNLKNFKTAWGNTVQIEVVAHSKGIGFLLKDKTTQQAAIDSFAAKGVRFVACENSLREQHIDKVNVIAAAGFVPVGVGEIVMKQEEGWSYLKGGF